MLSSDLFPEFLLWLSIACFSLVGGLLGWVICSKDDDEMD